VCADFEADLTLQLKEEGLCGADETLNLAEVGEFEDDALVDEFDSIAGQRLTCN
jgi:hypothetical protein